MQEQHPVRRIPLGVAAGLTAAILATGGATAWWSWTATSKKPSLTTTAPQPARPPQSAQAPAGTAPTVPSPPATAESAQSQQPQPPKVSAERTTKIYWIKDVNNTSIQLVPSAIAVDSANNPEVALEAAFRRLLAGPTSSAVTTTIPEGTKLRSITTQKDGVHIDLSQAFTSGGGSASMQARLAQILYTATSSDPKSKVWISVEGEPLETLGGEGLFLEQPITRQNFVQNFTL